MKVKQDYLNKETLCDKYNFKYNPQWKEYKYAGRWSKLLVQSNGDIDLVTDMSNDCFPIPNILLDMIKDGIVTK